MASKTLVRYQGDARAHGDHRNLLGHPMSIHTDRRIALSPLSHSSYFGLLAPRDLPMPTAEGEYGNTIVIGKCWGRFNDWLHDQTNHGVVTGHLLTPTTSGVLYDEVISNSFPKGKLLKDMDGRWLPRVETLEQLDIAGLEEGYLVFATEGNEIVGLFFLATKTLFIPMFVGEYAKSQTAEYISRTLGRVANLVSVPPSEKKEKQKLDRPKNLTIGSDIEFSVVDSDYIFHSAIEFVNDSTEAEIGTDGNVETLEARTRPAHDPIELVENVEMILENLAATLPDGYDLLSGGGADVRRSTGLHIHFAGTSFDRNRNPETQKRHILGYCEWLDNLLQLPIALYVSKIARADDRYGRLSDWRARLNHGEFPHHGFEYRTLATIMPNAEVTTGLFAVAWCAMLAYETNQEVKINLDKFGVEWYKDLPDFEKYEKYITAFVKWVLSRPSAQGPILNTWMNHGFEKDKECDMKVTFMDDGHYMNIAPFFIYNPQKRYDVLIVYNRGEGDKKVVAFRELHKDVQKYIVGQYGYPCIERRKEGPALMGGGNTSRIQFMGIPDRFLREISRNSIGSRNRVKMFVTDVAKYI